MSLSSFGYDVLKVLDEAGGPLSVGEIANQLSSEKHGHISKGVVGVHLEHALTKYVGQDGEGNWKIASPHHGKFAPSKRPMSEVEEDIQSEAEPSGNEEDPLDELSQLILRMLAHSAKPLRAKTIAERISDGSHGVKTREINRRLYNKLDDHVKQDAKYRWGLTNRAYGGLFESIDEEKGGAESEAPSGSEDEEKPASRSPEEEENEEVDETEVDTADDSREETGTELGHVAPDGRVGKINRRLETAKQIAFLLDLLAQPLSIRQITELLDACGREVQEETVRQCLEAELKRYVEQREEKYRLATEESETDPTSSTGTDEASGDVSLSERPVDAATRATISGHRYEYVFDTRNLNDGSLFASQIRGGTVSIELNSSHPAFSRFELVVDEGNSIEGTVAEELRALVRLLLISWTDVEGDLRGQRKELAEDIRKDWGRALRLLLREREES